MLRSCFQSCHFSYFKLFFSFSYNAPTEILKKPVVEWFKRSTNSETRILSNSTPPHLVAITGRQYKDSLQGDIGSPENY